MKQTKRQKILLYALPLSILGIGTISAPAILLFKKEDRNNEVFYLNNKSYTSRIEWEKAIRKLARQIETHSEKTIYYSNTKNKSFSDINNFKKFLANHIHTIEGSHYGDIDKNELNVDGSLSSNLMNQFNFDEPKEDENGEKENDNTTAYMGKNGIAYESEDEAKDSYANTHTFYKFQGKYYSSKQEIKNMIHKEILRINSEFADDTERAKAFKEFFAIKQPDNIYQAPTNIVFVAGEFDQEIEESKLDEFIESNCKKYVSHNNGIYEVDNFSNRFLSSDEYLKKLPILNVQSNQGRKKYLIDNDIDDPCNLYGSYVHESTGRDIENITDYKKWSKQPTNDFKLKRHNSQNQSLVNKFISSLLSTANANFIEKYIKRHKLNKTQQDELTKEYVNDFSIFKYFKFRDKFQTMKKELTKVQINETDSTHKNLFSKLESIITFTKRGKNGGFFNQISITYLSGLAHLIKYEASSKAINAFKDYYRTMFKELDDCVKGVIGEELYKDNNGKAIDLVELFGIDDLGFDFNSDFTYFINVFANNSRILNAISVITNAMTAVTTTNSLTKFNSNFLLRQADNDDDLILYKSLYEKYAFIGKDSPYVYSDEEGKYIKNKDFKRKLNEYEDAQINLTVLSALQVGESFSRSVEATLSNIAKNLDKYISNRPRAYKVQYQETFSFIQTSTLEYHRRYNSSDTTTINRISRLNVNNNAKDAKQMLYEYNKVKKNEKFSSLLTIRNKTIVKYGDGTIKLEKIETTTDKIAEKINKYKSIAAIAADVFKLISIFNSKDNINVDYEALGTIKSIFNSIIGAFPPNPVSLCIGAALNIIMDLAMQIIGKKTTSDYVYTDTGNVNDSYVWDGGITNSRFWGLIVTEERSIKHAKLLDPIEYIPEFVNSYYYFNGKKYTNLDSTNLKADALTAILNGDVITNDIHSVYSFEKDLKKFEEGDNAKYFFSTIDDLKKHLKVNERNLLKTRYLTEGAYMEFDSVQEPIWTKNYDEISKTLLQLIDEKLRPTLVMKIPELSQSNIPIDQLNKDYHGFNNNSINYKTILKQLNGEKELKSNEFLMFDTNLFNTKIGKYFHDYLMKTYELRLKLFREKFNVLSKMVSKEMLFTNKNYDELKSSTRHKIFKIYGINGEYKMFLSYDTAINYLHKKNYLDITQKTEEYEFLNKYFYDGKYFNSWDEVIKYCEIQSDKEKLKRENASKGVKNE